VADDLKKRRREKTIKELKTLVDSDPEPKERTIRMLKEVQKTTSIRLSQSMLDKIDEMAVMLSGDLKYAPKGHLNRSETIKLAIAKGFGALEAELKRRK
jgi:hypothetical protein